MGAGVDSDVARTPRTRHYRLEPPDVAAVAEEREDTRLIDVSMQNLVGQVAFEAAGVVLVSRARRIGLVAYKSKPYRAEVDGDVGEGPVGNTTSAGTVREN